jgi:hypothetical protein
MTALADSGAGTLEAESVDSTGGGEGGAAEPRSVTGTDDAVADDEDIVGIGTAALIVGKRRGASVFAREGTEERGGVMLVKSGSLLSVLTASNSVRNR